MPAAVYAGTEFQHGEPLSAQKLIISAFLSPFFSPSTFAIIVVVYNDVAEEDVVRVCVVDVVFQ